MDLRNRLRLPFYIAQHPANQGHVMAALLRSARFQLGTRLFRRPVVAQLGEAQMYVHLGNTAATKVIYGSPPDWEEMMAWKRLTRPGDLFIDVGANVGTYALWVASLKARVKAIEPDLKALERLRANIALNPTFDVEVISAALSDREGTIGFTQGLDTVNRIGLGRVVQCLTLDGVLGEGRARGVKVDVEGFEQLVLEGAIRALEERRVDIFQLEWNGMSRQSVGADRGPVARMLREAGYLFRRPDRSGALSACDPEGFGPDVFAVSPDAPL